MSESPLPVNDQQAAPPVSGARWLLRGIAAAGTSVQGWVLVASFIGFGGLVRDVDFPLGAALLSTLLVWALPAQVLLVGGFAAGNAAPVIALAVGLSSVRLFPMVASLMPYLRARSGRIGPQFMAAHYIAVTVWVEAIRNLPNLPAAARLPFLFGLANTFVAASCIALLIGHELAGTLPRALAVGLLFLTPISFLLQLVRNGRDVVDRLALIFGLALAPVLAEIGGRLDLLWTGLIGGFAAWAVHLYRKRRT